MDYEFRADTLTEAIKEVFREYYQEYDNTKMSVLANGYGTAITISVNDIDVAFIALKKGDSNDNFF